MQIEIAVVRHIDQGILVTGTIVMNFQLIFFCESVGDSHLKGSWKALVHIRAHEMETHAVLLLQKLHIPHPAAVASGTAVADVLAFIFFHEVFFSIDGKFCMIHTVSASSDGSSEIRVSFFIIQHIVIAQSHVLRVSVLIRHIDAHQRSAVVQNLNRHAFLIGDCDQMHHFPIRSFSKYAFCHSHN